MMSMNMNCSGVDRVGGMSFFFFFQAEDGIRDSDM